MSDGLANFMNNRHLKEHRDYNRRKNAVIVVGIIIAIVAGYMIVGSIN